MDSIILSGTTQTLYSVCVYYLILSYLILGAPLPQLGKI